MAVELPAVYVKDGKPARHVTNESERTAAVFEGFKPAKSGEAKSADADTDPAGDADKAPTDAEKAAAQRAEAGRTTPKPGVPTNRTN